MKIGRENLTEAWKNNNNNRFMTLCLWLPRWAGTRRNIHPPTPPDHQPSL